MSQKNAKKAVGIDLAKSKVRKAIESSKEEKLKNVEFLISDAEKLPFKDNIFDVVLCAEVLEHLPNPQETLKEILRVSKGGAVISVPTRRACITYIYVACHNFCPFC